MMISKNYSKIFREGVCNYLFQINGMSEIGLSDR
jgi:hypothetical protein